MGLTNFPNGITSFGIPVLGGAAGIPFTGNYYFVNESNGLDGNVGTSPSTALQTLGAALNKCTAGNNDVVFFEGTIHTTATLNWSKNFTHLVGLNAPTQINQRARISSSGSTVFTPLVNVTAQGCLFMNFSTFYGFSDASAQICWAEAGQRNAYYNVGFLGMGNATGAAAQTGSRHLTVGSGGQGENTFIECQVGLDTVTRSVANASLEFLGGTPRNVFRRCIFPAYTSAATALFVTAGASAMDRWQLFEDCAFINCTKSGSTAMTAAFSLNASAGGLILWQRSTIVGATDFEAVAATNQIFVDGAPPVAATSGLAINQTT